MDVLTKEQRRKNMQRIKGKNTSIEIKLCKALWKKGYHYRKNYKELPGSPDIVLTKYKVAIFCDSEFFHGKDWDKLKVRLEKGEKGDYWIKKITRNMERDEDVNKQLMFRGWTVLRFWGDEIKKNTDGKKTAYAWSGGKDSLVLGEICHMAGITDCVLVICNLEYREFMEWTEKNRPEKLSVINTGQDMEWLAAHPGMLFPQDSRAASRWFSIVQHRGQALYYKNEHLDMIILGRRLADGNYVGNGSNIYTDRHGVTRYSPLSGWTNEQVLAFIYYYGLELPPIYKWKNGYLCGTHPWPARQWTGNIKNAW